MIISVPHTTTNYTYFDAGGVTFAVPFESISYTYYIKGGVCDGEDIYTCKQYLTNIEKKRLLDTVNTSKTCILQGFVWNSVNKYPQIPSYQKPQCSPTYQQICTLAYEGQEPISATCKWDAQNLTRSGMHEQIKRILEKGRYKR